MKVAVAVAAGARIGEEATSRERDQVSVFKRGNPARLGG